MRITIEEREDVREVEVTILCTKADTRVLDMVARLHMLDRKVTGTVDGRTRIVNAEDVLYAESVDGCTFIYTADAVLESPLRLVEVEGRLADCGFLRVAKGCVLNFRQVESLEPGLNGRIVATMANGERVIVSRRYAPDVRHKLEML